MKKVSLCLLTLVAMLLCPGIVLYWFTQDGVVLGAVFLIALLATLLFSIFATDYAILMSDTRLVHSSGSDAERWLLAQVSQLSEAMGVVPPALGIVPIQGVNAYSVGWRRARSLVGISEGVLLQCDEAAIRALLARQIQVIASGDTAVLTMMQAVLNVGVFCWAQCARVWVMAAGIRRDSITEAVYAKVVLGLQWLTAGAGVLLGVFTRASVLRADVGESANDALKQLADLPYKERIGTLLMQLGEQEKTASKLPDPLATLAFYPEGATGVSFGGSPEIVTRQQALRGGASEV